MPVCMNERGLRVRDVRDNSASVHDWKGVKSQ